MSVPDQTAAVAGRPRGLPEVGGVFWWLLAAAAAVLGARLTMASIQMGCSLAIVVLVVGLYVRHRTVGLAAMWVVWLVAPFLRRVFLLEEPVAGAEPLALTPFLVTAALVALELSQLELSRRTRRMLWMAAAGFMLGLPAGLIIGPTAAVFALFAYLTGLGTFVIGYRDAEAGRTLTLPTILMLATPLLAFYSFRQYYLPLPDWDHVWYITSDLNTAGAPEAGKVRVWSTLNSPGTYALVLGVSLIAFVTAARLTPLRLLAAGLVFGSLALTYVRSAWLSLAVALVAVLVASRGRALKRVAAVAVLVAVAAPFTLGGSTGAALTERVGTFGALDTDESAQARSNTSTRGIARSLGAPIGFGIGRAGEASRLGTRALAFRITDNGYLSLLFQVGPVGFLLVMTLAATAMFSAWRNALRRLGSADVMTAGVLTFMAVMMVAGDQLFGVAGMIFWYTSGLAMRRRELQEGIAG